MIPDAGWSILERKHKQCKLRVTAHSSHGTFYKMRDEPIRGTGGHKSGGSGDSRGILGSSEQRAPQALPYMGERQDFQAKFL